MGAKTVYKSTESEHLQLSFFQFNASCGMQLDSQNEWVKDANLLPWRVWESQYSAIFMTTTGNVAKPSRMVMRTLKEWSDLPFLSCTYWSLMEETEKCVAIAEKTRSEEAMLRTQVLTGWLYAVKDRIEELGGRIEV